MRFRLVNKKHKRHLTAIKKYVPQDNEQKKSSEKDRLTIFGYLSFLLFQHAKLDVCPALHKSVSLKTGKIVKTIQKVTTKHKKRTINEK